MGGRLPPDFSTTTCLWAFRFWRGIFLKGRGWERAGALLLVPFVILAHPLGLVWLIGASVYIVAAERMSAWAQIALTGTAVCGLVLVRVYRADTF